MNLNWDLNVLYEGFEDPKFLSDMEKARAMVMELPAVVEEAKKLADAEGLKKVLMFQEEESQLIGDLYNYISLRQSTESTDPKAASLIAKMGRILADGTEGEVACDKYIGSMENIEEICAADDFLKEYTFLCLEKKKEMSHMLSDEAESVISRMKLTGSDGWEQLHSFLTSTVKVDYNGTQVTLSEIRNLAYDESAEVRKAAYEAELKAYDKIRDSIAFSLNNLKNQVITECEMRGFESPLMKTLEQSRMQKKTLDAMFTAMKESRPSWEKYMKAKAKLLGHEGGLPFYDLFAPVGKADMTFTVEESGEYLVRVFSQFAPDSAALIKEAYEENWIDFMPRDGKVGGAFCANLGGHDKSRVLTNFSGDFGSVDTLAHELGHAYHDRMIASHRILNQDYPMPIAETASTFNETHLTNYALSQAASDEEKLFLLEQLLQGANQTISDIYSRFLFEDAVFNRCREEFLMADQLCEIMLNAQKEAYGEGLDHDVLHPYMWLCKGHYYSAGYNYYNFPYAFGCMLSMGLYAKYQEEGEAFLPKYRALLEATPVKTMEEIGEQAGIDLTTPDFWRSALKAFADLIDIYADLAEKM